MDKRARQKPIIANRLRGCIHTVLLLVTLTVAQAETIDRIAAVVNDDVITQTELDAAVRFARMQLRQQGVPIPSETVLQHQVLERMVNQRLQLQLADVAGIRVDDDTLNETIKMIASQNGLSVAEFRNVLDQEGVDFAQFRENIREEIIITRLRRQQIDSRITITESELSNFLATQKAQGNLDDEYLLGHILVAVSASASPEELSAAREKAEAILKDLRNGSSDFAEMAIARSDGQQALKGGTLGWRKAGELPTVFSSIVPRMEPGEISGIIRSPSGFHIIKLLDYRAGKPHIVQQTHIRQILLHDDPLTSDEATRQRLMALREQILNESADFAGVAREYSDDPASAAAGGDLGWVSPGELPPPFEEAVAATPSGNITLPFQTTLGWHIAQVVERRQHDDTRDFTRNRARDLLRRRKIEQETQAWMRRLRDDAYVDLRLGS